MRTVAACAALLLGGCAAQAEITQANQDDEGVVKIRSVLDQDTREVWSTLASFQRLPTVENSKRVFSYLDDVLRRWESHPPGVVVGVFEGIEKHHLQSGAPYLVRFARPDIASHEGGAYVMSAAVRALAKSQDEFDVGFWASLAKEAPASVTPTVAFALGLVDDDRSVPILNDLLRGGHPETMAGSIGSLAKYCASGDRVLNSDNLDHSVPKVRQSVTWWFSRCGEETAVDLVVPLLVDSDPLVRRNIIEGLARLSSTAACESIEQLTSDPSLTVAESASRYDREVCSAKRFTDPGTTR